VSSPKLPFHSFSKDDLTILLFIGLRLFLDKSKTSAFRTDLGVIGIVEQFAVAVTFEAEKHPISFWIKIVFHVCSESPAFHGSRQGPASGIRFFYFLFLFSCLARRLPIFEDEMVNDFPAIDALPPEEMFLMTIKLLPDHRASASITFHQKLLFCLILFVCCRSFPLTPHFLSLPLTSPRKTVS